MKVTKFAILPLAAVMVLAACGGEEASLDPPEINYGVDMAEMGMPVVDPRFTVATLPEDGDEWLLFDDIGEFLKYYQNQSSEFQVMWVPDHDSEEWIHAEDAWYLQSDEYCYSPMRWCVATLDSEDAALEAQSEHGGDLWSWESVMNEDWSQAPMPTDHDHAHEFDDQDGQDDHDHGDDETSNK